MSASNFNKTNKFLEKVDKAVGKDTKIKIKEIGSGIAAADVNKKIIYINGGFYPRDQDEEENIQALGIHKGLNYHELAHILYTCANVKYEDWNIKVAHNVLEDARIESLFSLKYPVTRKYFRASVYKFIDAEEPKSFILLYGRRSFISSKLIKAVEKEFTKYYGKAKASQTKKIINEFLVTVKPKRQIELAKKLAELFGDLEDFNKSQIPEIQKSKAGTGEDETKQLQKKLQKKDEEKGEKEAGKEKSAEEIINDALKNNKEKIEKEINEEIAAGNLPGGKENNPEAGTLYTPEPREKLQVTQLKRFLNVVKNDLGNVYVKDLKKGRFDLRRVFQNQASQKLSGRVFKKYLKDDKNQTKLLACIQVDTSGSVNDAQFKQEMSAAWVISRALEESGGLAEVQVFDHCWYTAKEPGQEVGIWHRTSYGGTRGAGVLKEAQKNLNRMEKVHGVKEKLCITITDGCFCDANEVGEVIEEMHKDGITTVLIGVGGYAQKHEAYTFNINTEFEGLLKGMKTVIEGHANRVKTKIIKAREEQLE